MKFRSLLTPFKGTASRSSVGGGLVLASVLLLAHCGVPPDGSPEDEGRPDPVELPDEDDNVAPRPVVVPAPGIGEVPKLLPADPPVDPPAERPVDPPVAPLEDRPSDEAATDPPKEGLPVVEISPLPESAQPGAPAGKRKITVRGSTAMPADSDSAPPEEESKEYHTVDVYYGTDREPTGVPTHNDKYGAGRNREGPMEYGKTTISIPLHHKIGVVERPKWYKLEFSEDPKKHVVIVDLQKMGVEDFFHEVGSTARDKPKNEALLFVHGFNVSFDSAIRRTGQIAFDLDFGGVALAYSWPSQGALSSYPTDETNAEWSVPHLARFLLDLQEKAEFEKVHVIAHSMGTRVLGHALAYARNEGFDLALNNVVLAAPDIDADVFKDQILPKIKETTANLTMYASSDDTALKVSQRIHGNARLGLSGAQIKVLEGMDTVNASGIDTSMLGHGYYGSHKVVVADIFNLIIKGLDPPGRKLVAGPLGEWGFLEVPVAPPAQP